MRHLKFMVFQKEFLSDKETFDKLQMNFKFY